MEKYDHAKIEKKWQKRWEESQAFAASDDSARQKSYLLVEFPYPSGEGLHTGHVRSYAAMDAIARKRRMEGFNVLYPIGWDAFGLPTENYAIKTGIQPKVVTKQNTDTFRRQLKGLGLSFDWSREINTTNPAYYKWTQWIFLRLFKKGLAYKATTTINWCPKCKIGLANEEVVDNACERCGYAPVEKREKEQWMLAITKYAQRLYDDLDAVDYIERAKVQQRNWIGPSEGAEIEFVVAGANEIITVFTTRPDTLFGATYLVLAPEHPLVQPLAEKSVNKDAILHYVGEARNKTEIERTAEGKEKTGVELKGVKAINPANREEVPVFVADYVLGSYGTGAIMAVPAHDERDFAFAKKFGLPIIQVIEPITGTPQENPEFRKSIVAVLIDRNKNQVLSINWGELGGRLFVGGGREEGEDAITTAMREIKEETGYSNIRFISQTPIIHHNYFAHSKNVARRIEATGFLFELVSDTRGEQLLEEDEKGKFALEWLPLDRAEQEVREPLHHAVFDLLVRERPYTGFGVLTRSDGFDGLTSEEAKRKMVESVGGRLVTTYKLRDWVFSRQRYWGEPIPMIHCEKDGWIPVPEEQLPVLLPEVEKYQPTDTGESPLANIAEWVNTTCPTCGGPATRETDVMPNWAGSSWYYLRYSDPRNAETFAAPDKLDYWTPVDWYNGGMEHTVLHLLYSRFWHKFLFDEGLVPTSEPYAKRTSHGLILAQDGSKMSKSKGNVVNPDELVERMGADSLRLYEMFMGPFDQAISWNTDGVVGMRRFLERVWTLADKVAHIKPEADALDAETEALLHQTVKKVTEDIEALKMNTAVSALMILVNHLYAQESPTRIAFESLLALLSPFAPHITHELAEKLEFDPGWHQWPVYDPVKVVAADATIAVQINGRVRTAIKIASNATEAEALATARANETVAKWLQEGKEVRAVYIPGKIINLVLDLQSKA